LVLNDLALVRFLIRATEAADHPLEWRLNHGCEFRAQLNGVKLSLFHFHAAEHSPLRLRLSCGERRTMIEEPPNLAGIGARYKDEEDRALAESLQALAECVSAHASAPPQPARRADASREALYRTLLEGAR
jgi:hypothetical protein